MSGRICLPLTQCLFLVLLLMMSLSKYSMISLPVSIPSTPIHCPCYLHPTPITDITELLQLLLVLVAVCANNHLQVSTSGANGISCTGTRVCHKWKEPLVERKFQKVLPFVICSMVIHYFLTKTGVWTQMSQPPTFSASIWKQCILSPSLQ